MVKTAKESKQLSKDWSDDYKKGSDRYIAKRSYLVGYREAQRNMLKYKEAFDILNCYFDIISDEEQPKVAKQLEKLGV